MHDDAICERCETEMDGAVLIPMPEGWICPACFYRTGGAR